MDRNSGKPAQPIRDNQRLNTDALALIESQAPEISVVFVHAILRHIKNPDDRNLLLEQSQISPSHLNKEGGVVSALQLAELQSKAILLLNDEMLGYAASPLPVGTWKVMSRACLSSVNLAELIKRYREFYHLFHWGMRIDCELQDEFVHINFQPQDELTFAPFLYESCLHNTHRFFSWMIDASIPVPTVNLSYPEPEGEKYYRQILPFSNWQFGQSKTGFVFPAKMLDAPCKQNEMALRQFWQQTSFHLLANRYNARSWSTKIRRLMQKLAISTVSLEEVACQLHIHPQTLRRRLSEEGTSFRQIKHRLSYDKALHYLNIQGVSIDDAAIKSGFSDTRAFIRAFKNWTGMTPHIYRAQQGRKD